VALPLGQDLRIGLKARVRVAKFFRDVLDDVPATKLPLDGALTFISGGQTPSVGVNPIQVVPPSQSDFDEVIGSGKSRIFMPAVPIDDGDDATSRFDSFVNCSTFALFENAVASGACSDEQGKAGPKRGLVGAHYEVGSISLQRLVMIFSTRLPRKIVST
jgi:hypothetical protein